jgi:hypothetical protein
LKRDIKNIFYLAAILLMIYSQYGCARPEYRPGTYRMSTQITITEDWCYVDGKPAQGSTKYIGPISWICVSKRSNDIHGTFLHELTHAYLVAIGEEATAYFAYSE